MNAFINKILFLGISFTPGIVGMWSLATLAFERYFTICRPLGNTRLQVKHATLGLLFVWTFSFIWTIPPVLGWSSYTVSKIGTTCEPNWLEYIAFMLASSTLNKKLKETETSQA